MTKSVNRNSYKVGTYSSLIGHVRDDYGAIGDHLCSHVHLTNCIHLKNHMHRLSTNFPERYLTEDLIMLQKLRTLRDPSASPGSRVSPNIVGSFVMKSPKHRSTNGKRRSRGVHRVRKSKSLPLAGSVATAKVAAVEEAGPYDIKESGRDADITKGEMTGTRSWKCDSLSESQVTFKDEASNVAGLEKRAFHNGANDQILHPKALSEQLQKVAYPTGKLIKKDIDLVQNGRHESIGRTSDDPGIMHDYCGWSNKERKFKLKVARQEHRSIFPGGVDARCKSMVAPVPGAQDSKNHNDCLENELEAAQVQGNVCGIPWNWSRIHHQGKTFLDIAGRSLSCGLSDSRIKNCEGLVPQKGHSLKLATVSDHTTISKSSEVLPLLSEAQESQGSTSNDFLSRDHSVDLEVFSNHRFRHDRNSDVASESTSSWEILRRYSHSRYRSLTQKYTPKTFKDLVGQSLIVQALSNAILRRKFGLIYAFFGLHGTGKTSCARVFAKALNCRSVDQPKPCDVCSSCISNNLGRSKDVLEVGPVGSFDFGSINNVFNNMMLSPRSSRYRVFIFDDCDSLSPNLWSAISKVIALAPRHVILVLICSSLDRLPHLIKSRCQKFFFPKVKDSEIISTLQWIATSEGIEIDKDALKVIASQSFGSLRDALMILDQLSFLGKKISLPLVQELVGLVSDEELVDLLDMALSADTVNTVNKLREIREFGIDPVVLMSQLATMITDILAGRSVFTQDRLQRKFFCRPTLSKEDMERLRQALKKLCGAEKQLRASNEKLTWLTAALLQLDPDQQFILPTSSTDGNLNHNPNIVREVPRSSFNKQDKMQHANKSFPRGAGLGNSRSEGANGINNCVTIGSGIVHNEQTSHHQIFSGQAIEESNAHYSGNRYCNTEKIWQAVLEHIPSDTLRQFLYHEGNLSSVRLAAAATVYLMFSSNAAKYRAEKFRGQILHAFEFVLASPVLLKIQCKPRIGATSDVQVAPTFSSSESGSSIMRRKKNPLKKKRPLYSSSEDLAGTLVEKNTLGKMHSSRMAWLHAGPHVITEDEIIEVGFHGHELTNKTRGSKEKVNVREEASTSQHHVNFVSSSERKENSHSQRKSIIRGKVSLAHIIQWADGCSYNSGGSRHKTMSGEKLEKENMRLEPRPRSLFRWRALTTARVKPSAPRIRTRKPRPMLKFLACGRCLRTRTPK